jgi:hypothetical protein
MRFEHISYAIISHDIHYIKSYNEHMKNKQKRNKKDNSKKGDMFSNCRSCKTIITNDYRSKFDTRYCADCL